MASALLLIDIQNDFVPGGALAVKEGDQIITVVNRLIPVFDHVIATQDWHPSDHGSFASLHPGTHPGDTIMLGGAIQTLWPDHCIQNSVGARLVEELNSNGIEKIFYKGTRTDVDSYSGFFDNQRRYSTGLDDYLRAQNVDTVYIAGLATDYCVKFTALDANALGFNTYIVTDACRGVNLAPDDSLAAINEMVAEGCHAVVSEQVFERLAD